MTVLVANIINKRGQIDPMALTAWAVIPNVGGETCTIGQSIVLSDSPPLYCTFDEFLALIAEGGKIVDVRHLQEPK